MSDDFGIEVQSEPMVRVYHNTYKGKEKVHIRTFWKDGPTKKGVALDYDCVLETVQALLDCYNEHFNCEEFVSLYHHPPMEGE